VRRFNTGDLIRGANRLQMPYIDASNNKKTHNKKKLNLVRICTRRSTAKYLSSTIVFSGKAQVKDNGTGLSSMGDNMEII
jgi:hypothetical protein